MAIPPPLVNSLLNGSFEHGAYTPTGTPTSWQRSEDGTATLTWASSPAHGGQRSLAIAATKRADVAWTQTVQVTPGQRYRFSGWIKTNGVTHAIEGVDAGANLSIVGTFTRSEAVIGDHDWTYRSVTVAAPADGRLTLGARLGYWAGTTTGRAWYDNLQLAPVVSVSHPSTSWKVLALVYDRSKVSIKADDGPTGRFSAHLTATERQTVDTQVRRFVNTDIPALSSGLMVPRLTIRHRPLTPLEPYGGGWWPSEQGSAADRAGDFDATVVIYANQATNPASGEHRDLGGDYAGLTPDLGTRPTDSMVTADSVLHYEHLNVLKHEFGHALTSFYRAAGTAPEPMVDIHHNELYVNCRTGRPYLNKDETDEDPIPNSIYNNDSGFTHDYYSGTTALATDPQTCLGIAPSAWAAGGPRAVTGLQTYVAQAEVMRDDVDALVRTDQLSAARGRLLDAELKTLIDALTIESPAHARVAVGFYVDTIERYRRRHRLSAANIRVLHDDALVVQYEIGPTRG
ncbi:MAG: hypothetical protein ACRYG2_32960 [Janthinobacterium lividum]